MGTTDEPRLSLPALKILSALVSTLGKRISGYEVMRVTGVASGSLYPILARFESAGWVSSDWENIDPAEAGRPRRRLYRVTALGKSAYTTATESFRLGVAAT
jgi:DNA-binding PadR family transcriptional regulator